MKSKIQIPVVSISLLISLGLFSSFFPQTSAQAAECPTSKSETYLSASFEWSRADQQKIPMQFVVVREAHAPGSHQAKAYISSSAGCEAVCDVVAGLDSDEAYDLSCRSTGFGTLSAKATLFARRTSGAKRSPAVLRFGNWIEGYRQFPLAVSMNRTSRLHPRPLIASKLAQAR